VPHTKKALRWALAKRRDAGGGRSGINARTTRAGLLALGFRFSVTASGDKQSRRSKQVAGHGMDGTYSGMNWRINVTIEPNGKKAPSSSV